MRKRESEWYAKRFQFNRRVNDSSNHLIHWVCSFTCSPSTRDKAWKRERGTERAYPRTISIEIECIHMHKRKKFPIKRKRFAHRMIGTTKTADRCLFVPVHICTCGVRLSHTKHKHTNRFTLNVDVLCYRTTNYVLWYWHQCLSHDCNYSKQ